MPHTFSFQAIGTIWNITTDERPLEEKEKETLLAYIADFEKRFSRFLPDSEVNQFKTAVAGSYQISAELAKLLQRASELRTQSQGRFDPAVAGLLERAGYDASYTLTPKPEADSFTLPSWDIDGATLILEGPASFDLGGIGKGYAIDMMSGLLSGLGFECYLVEAGGDAFGTRKQNGQPWRVAVQYPGKPDTAAGLLTLSHQGVAASDIFRRRWKNWNHIVDPKQNRAVTKIIGAVACANTAWDADCMTSALFFCSEENYSEVSRHYQATYLVFQDDDTCLISPEWEGELFH
jgi:thiamine biosynthesis lipoprotein